MAGIQDVMEKLDDVLEKLDELEAKLGKVEAKVNADRIIYTACAGCNASGMIGGDPTGCTACDGTGFRVHGKTGKVEE